MTLKANHKNTIPLSEDALQIAAENMTGKNKGDWLFIHPETGRRYTPNRLYQLWVKWRGEQFTDITVHELIRHSFCTQLMANTSVSTLTAKDLMRHRTLAMTDRYAHRNVEGSRPYVNARKGLTLVYSKAENLGSTGITDSMSTVKALQDAK